MALINTGLSDAGNKFELNERNVKGKKIHKLRGRIKWHMNPRSKEEEKKM